jgi:hypothetical protein
MPVRVKKKTTDIEEIPAKPPVEVGNFSVVLSIEEMFSLVSLLTFSKKIFEKMADNSLKVGDVAAMEIYNAHSKVSIDIYQKLNAVAGIGEPTSREVH